MEVQAALLAHAAFGLNPANWGATELVVILVIALLLFGPKRLPQLSRAIGRSIRDFRKGLSEVHDDIRSEMDDDEETDKSRKDSDENLLRTAPSDEAKEPKPHDRPDKR